jgi:hypothetical protein
MQVAAHVIDLIADAIGDIIDFVFHVALGLGRAAFGLVGKPFALQALVVGRVADAFFGPADDFLAETFDLVARPTHRDTSCVASVVAFWVRVGAAK